MRDVISHSVYKLKRRKSTESFVENTQNDIEFVTSYLQDCNVLVAIDECDNLMWDTQFHQDLEFLLRSCPGYYYLKALPSLCPIMAIVCSLFFFFLSSRTLGVFFFCTPLSSPLEKSKTQFLYTKRI